MAAGCTYKYGADIITNSWGRECQCGCGQPYNKCASLYKVTKTFTTTTTTTSGTSGYLSTAEIKQINSDKLPSTETAVVKGSNPSANTFTYDVNMSYYAICVP